MATCPPHPPSRPFPGTPWPVFLALCLISSAASAGSGDTVRTRSVRPGIIHTAIHDPRGPWQIHVVEIELSRSDLRIEGGRARDSIAGRETTSSLASGYPRNQGRVVVAVNADFFEPNGESVNHQVKGREVVRAVIPPHDTTVHEDHLRSLIAVDTLNVPRIGRFRFDGRILWPRGGEERIEAVNVLRARARFVLFNRFFGEKTRADSARPQGRELPLARIGRRGDTLLARVSGPVTSAGMTRLDSSTLALACFSLPGVFDSLGCSVADTVRLLLGFDPPVPGLRMMLGGLPRIVHNGVPLEIAQENLEGAKLDFATRRHPRTGVGISEDGKRLVLITVDGRQEGSAGMSLEEFARLMVSRGVAEGLNFDGGGSTTMVIDGRVVNSPSDAAGERPVANALFVVERAE